MLKLKRIPKIVLVAVMFLVSLALWAAYIRAGTLEFDGVPVDLTTSVSEDLVIVPGEGGNTQIGDGTGANSNAVTNDDLHVTGSIESDGTVYSDSGIISGSDIISDTDSTDSLGSSTRAWINLYVDAIKTVSGTNLTLLPTSAYTIIGDAGTAGWASGNDDLFVSGILEVDGTLYADGDIYFTGTLYEDSSPFVTGQWTEADTYIYANNYTSAIVSDSGNLGIGTTSPTARLEVKNLIAGTTPTSFKIIAGTTGPDNFALQIQDYTQADKVVVLDNGRVGIGTTAPSVELEVAGDITSLGIITAATLVGTNLTVSDSVIDFSGYVEKADFNAQTILAATTDDIPAALTVDASRIVGRASTGNITALDAAAVSTILDQNFLKVYQEGGNAVELTDSHGDIRFYNNAAAEMLFLDEDQGKVGIGTTAPNSKLDVAGAVQIGSGYAGIGTSNAVNGVVIEGNVGIGTTSPEAALHVVGTIDIGEGNVALTVDSGGKVGIGTTAPDAGLHIGNDSVAAGSATGAEDLYVEGAVEVNGVIHADGGVTGNLTGDVTGNADTVTTNADLTGEVTSSGSNATTIADSITVTGWVMDASTATTPAVDDSSTSLATTAFCETTQNYLKTSELASASEINTGTDVIRANTPDALAGSYAGTKTVEVIAFDFTTATAVGDGAFYFNIPSSMTGMNLVTVHARAITSGTTGTTNIQIANVTDTTDMLSTVLTIDSAETGSDTAVTPAVINTTYDDIVTNDLLRIDVDAVSTTPAAGLIVTMEFRLP